MAGTDDAFTKQKGVFRNSWTGVSSSTSSGTRQSHAHHDDSVEYHFVFSQNSRTSPNARKHIADLVNRRKISKKQQALRPASKPGQLQWRKKTSDFEDFVTPPDSFSSKPQTILGAGRVDPFSSLPVGSSGSEQELIDHYSHQMYPNKVSHDLSAYMPRHAARATLYPMTDSTFAQSIQDQAAFHALLSYSGHHLATVRGEKISPSTLAHKAESIRIVNERLNDPQLRMTDGTIQTIILLSHIEHHFGDNSAVRIHFEGLQQIVLMRGGLSAMKTAPRLESQLYWLDFTSNRGIFTPFPVGFGAADKSNKELVVSVTLAQGQYIRACCEAFVNFFENMLDLASARKRSPAMLAAVNSATKPGAPLQLLHDYLFGPSSERACLGPSRLAILAHIHTALWDYRDSPKKTQKFLEHINKEMTENARHTKFYIDTLLWLLVQKEAGTKLERPKSTWLVRQLITIAKLLSGESWVMVEKLLLNCLLEEQMDVAGEASGWDPEKIREDITGQLSDGGEIGELVQYVRRVKFPDTELSFHRFEPGVLREAIVGSPLKSRPVVKAEIG